MLEAITSAQTAVISWFGAVFNGVIGEAGTLKELLPLYAIGVGVSITMLGFKVLRKTTWGA